MLRFRFAIIKLNTFIIISKTFFNRNVSVVFLWFRTSKGLKGIIWSLRLRCYNNLLKYSEKNPQILNLTLRLLVCSARTLPAVRRVFPPFAHFFCFIDRYERTSTTKNSHVQCSFSPKYRSPITSEAWSFYPIFLLVRRFNLRNQISHIIVFILILLFKIVGAYLKAFPNKLQILFS